MLFFVKVRLDLTKFAEMGRKLQSGELDRTAIKSVHCPQADPTVGLAIWEATDRADFDQKFAPHRPYYAEVAEITPVVTSPEAQQLIIQQLAAE